MKNGVELSLIFFCFAMLCFWQFENVGLGYIFLILQFLFLFLDDGE